MGPPTRNADTAAVYLYGGLSTFIIDGMVVGAAGIKLHDYSGDSPHTLHVGEQGAVIATHLNHAAVDVSGAGSVVNDGTIAGDIGILNAYDLIVYPTTEMSVENRGVISGNSFGLLLGGGNATAASVATITNHGTISGAVAAFQGGAETDTVTNRGTLIGNVRLGDGNDFFDNRGGTLRGGTVAGGGGDDSFLPGDGAEVIIGGEGFDTLDFRSGPGLRVSLIDASGTGRALGDSYAGIERVWGSLTGADTLIGDAFANTLQGFGAKDSLTGGLGNDRFVFAAPSEGGDLILDFHNLGGDDDAFEIVAAGFGGGLVAGGTLLASQYHITGSNKAGDADDRFVLRTTDATLWFDADGKGGAGPVLIADLQAGAAVTSADILLV